jgi:hypothetical protein
LQSHRTTKGAPRFAAQRPFDQCVTALYQKKLRITSMTSPV